MSVQLAIVSIWIVIIVRYDYFIKFALAMLRIAFLAFISGIVVGQSVFWSDDFSNPAQWTLNANLGTSVTPAQGTNDPAYNPWVINNLNYFTPSGPISGNSLKITIQPGTDFDGLGLSSGYTGYDPVNINEPNATDAIAILNVNIDATGKTGIILEFDYQTGGWLGQDYGTVLYSVDGGATWTELDATFTVTYNIMDANGTVLATGLTKPAAPPDPNTQNAFSNIDGVSSGNYWHRARIQLPPVCDNQPDLRIGFRWRNIVHTSTSPDYVGVSFNIDNIRLLVNPPVAQFTFSPIDPCAGDVITFDASASSPGGGVSITQYLWEFPGGTPSSATTNTPTIQVTYNTPNQYKAYLRVVNNNNDTSDYYVAIVNVANCAPKAIINGPLQVCKDSVAVYQDASQNVNPSWNPSWSWTFTGATPATATGPGPHNVTWNTLGSYSVTLTVTNDYGSDDTTITVEVIDCQCVQSASSRTRFWFEDFGTGCAHTSFTTANGTWTIVNTGFNAINANTWYISAEENGNGAGACGSGCGTNKTLHVGSTTLGDIGAAYDAGGCFFILPCTQTNKRIQIGVDASGYQNIEVRFEYMEYGDGTLDNAYFTYSTDGGVTWTEIDLPKTLCCGGVICDGLTQGLWTAYSIFLPAAADNNPNLMIGFRWQNNDDGVGTDPSFAVDNIEILGDPIVASSGAVWEGTVDNNWHNAANWSTGAVPDFFTDVEIPANPIGGRMPVIFQANAQARNVCNFGVITLQNDWVLEIDSVLLNEGAITSTTTNPAADVRFVGTNAAYKGSGTNWDADYEVAAGSDVTLLANLSCRSLNVLGSLIWSGKTITLYKNFSFTGTSTTDASSTLILNGPCTTCIDATTNQTLSGTVTIPNMIVNKSAGIAQMDPTANFTISNLLHIQQGILDQSTATLAGTGNLRMDDGEFWIAKLGVTVPELTGTYTLLGGKVRIYGAGAQTLRGGITYYKLHFDGSGIKTLSGNVQVRDSLYFTLPAATLGNHVDATTFTLSVLNPEPAIVYHTGGHVVGNFQRAVNPNGTYRFYVGSDGVSTTTYYEPLDIQTVGLSPTTAITVMFNKNQPNPLTISPPLTEFGATFADVQPEGYWQVTPDVAPNTGTYTVTQYPSAGWNFLSTSYTQVKQAAVTQPWTFGTSQRVTALKRQGYASFSNFAIAYSPQPLALRLQLSGVALQDAKLLFVQFNEPITQLQLQRSDDGQQWQTIATLPLTSPAQYKDFYPKEAYYRALAFTPDGQKVFSSVIFLGTKEEQQEVFLFPNPAETYAYIVNNTGSSITINVYDALGKQVYTNMMASSLHALPLTSWSEGIYFVRVQTKEGNVYSFQLMKK